MAKKKPSKKKAAKKVAKKKSVKKAAPKKKSAKNKVPKKAAVKKPRPKPAPQPKGTLIPPVDLTPAEVRQFLDHLCNIKDGTPNRAGFDDFISFVTREYPAGTLLDKTRYRITITHDDNMDASAVEVQVTRIEPK